MVVYLRPRLTFNAKKGYTSLLASCILRREPILSLFFLLACLFKYVVRASQPITINTNCYYNKDSPLLLVMIILLIIISVALIGLYGSREGQSAAIQYHRQHRRRHHRRCLHRHRRRHHHRCLHRRRRRQLCKQWRIF